MVANLVVTGPSLRSVGSANHDVSALAGLEVSQSIGYSQGFGAVQGLQLEQVLGGNLVTLVTGQQVRGVNELGMKAVFLRPNIVNGR